MLPLGQTFFILSLHIRVLLFLCIRMILHYLQPLMNQSLERYGEIRIENLLQLRKNRWQCLGFRAHLTSVARTEIGRNSSKFRVIFLKDAEGLEDVE